MAEAVRGILLDIEGTTSSIRFVYDVMFPYVRRELTAYLREHWDSPSLRESLELLARDLGHASLPDWLAATGSGSDPSTAQAEVERGVLSLMDQDVKATGLKSLQGLIWRSGFESGEMSAHVYDDVLPSLQRWQQAGLDLRIYSSGSVAAQRLFFGHSEQGDLLPYFSGHYDTTTGSKKDAASYRRIAEDFQLEPQQILFISDLPDELSAASEAGFQVRLCRRPGNAPVADGVWIGIHSFDELVI